MASRKWYGYTPDSKARKEEIEGITAFGYQCKLFRDDEKAAYIDRGKHLIPWMGDASLMIDRHDGRGYLSDLKPYDAEFCPKKEQLTKEDLETEKIIDEERYLELHTDMVEQATYEEEEMKRWNEVANGYGAVAFNYNPETQDVPPDGSGENGAVKAEAVDPDEEEEEPYEVSPELQLPPNIIPPKTIKQNTIIEKTASFLAKQPDGNQMEIVIKTKQINNPQFDFLNYGNVLNKYYRHMIKMIKNNRYTPKPQPKRKRKNSYSEGDGYLHPSLSNSTAQEMEPQTSESFLASVRAKLPAGQIANTAYAKLLSNMRKHTHSTSRSNSPAPPPPPQKHLASANSVPSAAQTSQDYSSAGNLSPYSSSNQPPVPGMEPVELPDIDPLPPGTEEEEEEEHGPHLPHDVHHSHRPHQHHQHRHRYDQETHHGRHRPPQQYAPPPPEEAAAADYNVAYEHGPVVGPMGPNGVAPALHHHHHGPSPPPSSTPPAVVHGPHLPPPQHGPGAQMYGPSPISGPSIVHLPALSPAADQYSQQPGVTPTYGAPMPGPPPPPPPDVQSIIDKMAKFAARNGLLFEVTIRNKNDPRFEFLQDWHVHHPYYLMKKQQYIQELAEKAEQEEREKEEKQNRSVSFRVKTKETEASNVGRGALMGADSDDDEDESHDGEKLADGNVNDAGAANSQAQQPEKPKCSQSVPTVRAEDALKNKLAMAARGKLATASKDDHVKAERKRKAAMFAAMLKVGGSGTQATVTSASPSSSSSSSVPPPALSSDRLTADITPSTPLPVQGPMLPPALLAPATLTLSTVATVSTPLPAPHHMSSSRVSASSARLSSQRRSRSPRSRKYRSRSRSYSPPQRSHKHRRRSRTPPSGYTKTNILPPVRMPRSSPSISKRSRRSRSRSRTRRSRSRNRSPALRLSSKSHKSSKKSKHRSRSPSKKKSKKRSRSRSQKRSRKSRSRSKSKRKKAEKEKSSKSSKLNDSVVVIREEKPEIEIKQVDSDSVHSSASSSPASSPERKNIKLEEKHSDSESESETEVLRRAALNSQAAKRMALANNGLNNIKKEEADQEEELEDGEVVEKMEEQE